MLYFFKFFERRGAHSLSRRIGKDVMILFFKFLQAPEETVVLRIGDDRRIKNVVAIVMLVDFLDEFFNLSVFLLGK